MTTISVTGMTCGHCEAAVRAELANIDGIQVTRINVVPEGVSTIELDGDAPMERIRAAIDEAGYEVVD